MIRTEAAGILRDLIDKVVIAPCEERGKTEAVLHGELAAILSLGASNKKSRASVFEVRLLMVAGARRHRLLSSQLKAAGIELSCALPAPASAEIHDQSDTGGN